MSNTTTVNPPVALKWHRSSFNGYTANYGDVMYWTKNPDVFKDETTPYVSFRVARDAHGTWELFVWTSELGQTTLRKEGYETMAQAKAVAAILAQAVANTFDAETRGADYYSVKSFLRSAEHAADMWVSYPEQRNEYDVRRLAEVNVTVTL
jgi:hypothetical protein